MPTTAITASGYPVSIGDAAITAVLGYAVVFVGLFALMLVIIAVGKIMAAKDNKPIAAAPAEVQSAPASAAAPAPGTAGQVKLYDTPDREAAMIMAIVANQLGKPLNELRFISIKEVK